MVNGWNYKITYSILQTNCSKGKFQLLSPECKFFPNGVSRHKLNPKGLSIVFMVLIGIDMVKLGGKTITKIWMTFGYWCTLSLEAHITGHSVKDLYFQQ